MLSSDDVIQCLVQAIHNPEYFVSTWKSACKRDPPRRRIWTHLRRTISPSARESRGSFLCLFVLLDRFAEAVALAVDLEDVAMMGQAIQQSRRHAFALEDLAPFAERQVTRDQQAGPFVAVGKNLEQQLGPGPTERQVAQFVTDQKVRPIQLAQKAVQLILLLSFFQTVDQPGRCKEANAPAGPTGGQAQGNRQMRLADTLTAQQAHVLMLIEPLTAGQLHDLLLAQTRHEAEVIGVQILMDRERRLLDAGLQGIGRTLGRFQFNQTQ